MKIAGAKTFGNQRYVTESELAGYAATSNVSAIVETLIESAMSGVIISVDSSITSDGTLPVQGSVIYSALEGKVDAVEGKGLSTKDFTAALESKLSAIPATAEANQNAITTLAITSSSGATASTSLTANSKTDTMKILAGNHITMSTGTKSVTINASYAVATTAADGLMGSAMVSKLNGITEGATKVESSTVSGWVSGWGYTKITNANVSTIVTSLAYTKDEVDTKLTRVYKYKSSIDTVSELPVASNANIGDVYNIVSAGTIGSDIKVNAGDNVAWNGTAWDVLAGTVDLSDYALVADVSALVSDAMSDAVTSASVTIESTLTSTGTNPVQGKVIYSAISAKTSSAFEKIAVKASAAGTATNITAGASNDTVTFIAGSNVTLTPDAASKTLTVNATDTVVSAGGSKVTSIVGSHVAELSNANGVLTIDVKADNTVVENGNYPVVGRGIFSHVSSSISSATRAINSNIAAVSSALDAKVEYDELAHVAFTGDYNDLINVPEVANVEMDSAITQNGSNPVPASAIYTYIQNNVAIPGSAVITLKAGGSSYGSFNVNATTATSADIPTATSNKYGVVKVVTAMSNNTTDATAISVVSAISATLSSVSSADSKHNASSALHVPSMTGATNGQVLTYDSATTSAKWASLPSVVDSATNATNATNDKNGNDITTTYQPLIDASHKLSTSLISGIGSATITLKAGGTAYGSFSVNATTATSANIPEATSAAFGVVKVEQVVSNTSNAVANKVVSAISSTMNAHIASTAIHVPAADASSNGKVLKVVNGTPAWSTDLTADGAAVLPSYNADYIGQVLQVTSDAQDGVKAAWVTATTPGAATVTLKAGGSSYGSFNVNATAATSADIPEATWNAFGVVKVDSALDGASTNPVQNQVIVTALNNKAPISRSIETIVDERTTSAAAITATTTQSALYDGMMVIMKLKYKTVAGTTLNLTLAGGTTTGAKVVVFNGTTQLSSNYVANNIIMLAYNSTDDKWYVVNKDQNTDTTPTYVGYMQSAAIAGTGGVQAATIIAYAPSSNGYVTISSGVTIDPNRRLFYTISNVNATSTIIYNRVMDTNNLQASNHTGWAAFTGKEELYIKGTYANGGVTIASGIFATTKPSTDDGNVYIPIGMAKTTSIYAFAPEQKLMKYYNGAFQEWIPGAGTGAGDGLAEIANATDAGTFVNSTNSGKAFIFTGDTTGGYEKGCVYRVELQQIQNGLQVTHTGDSFDLSGTYVLTDSTATDGNRVWTNGTYRILYDVMMVAWAIKDSNNTTYAYKSAATPTSLPTGSWTKYGSTTGTVSVAQATSGYVASVINSAAGGGGGSVTIDSAITSDGVNAVAGSAIYTELATKAAVEDLAQVAFTGDYNDLLNKPSGSGGGSVTVDSSLSSTSENPVQNKVIWSAIGNIESILASL